MRAIIDRLNHYRKQEAQAYGPFQLACFLTFQLALFLWVFIVVAYM